jgi:hypothetical protein
MVAKNVVIIFGHLIDMKEFALWCIKNNKIDTYFSEMIDPPESFDTNDSEWYDLFTDCYVFEEGLFTNKTGINAYHFPCCSEFGTKYFIVGRELKRYFRYSDEEWLDSINTENGPYDFNAIFDTIVKIDCSEICNNCGHHYRKPFSRCKKCHSTIKLDPESIRKIPKLFKNMIMDNGVFMILDDCASCT